MNRFISIFLLLMSTSAWSQVDLNLGLRAYYPFTGNANDVSGNNNNPTFNNASLTIDRLGNPNSAYHFNGTSNYMMVPNSPTLNTVNMISLCAWVRPMGFSAALCHGNSILNKGITDGPNGNYMMRYTDANVAGGHHCDGIPPDVAHENFIATNCYLIGGYTPFIQPNQWYSVVYTYDGTTVRLYVNCELKLERAEPGLNFTSAYDLYIGRFFNATFPYWMDGDLDEIRIYNRPLNQGEVNAFGGCSTACPTKNDFSFKRNPCSPLSVDFSTNATGYNTINWNFDDGYTAATATSSHSYANTGNYLVTMITYYNTCSDTVKKTIPIDITTDNQLILTPDTLFCSLTPKKLRTSPALDFCWSPITSLDDPNLPEPTTSTPAVTTYYFTAQTAGNNIVTNGNFINGNTNFTSDYTSVNPTTADGQYFIGSSPPAWNASLSNCTDHTGSSGNMMMVRAAPVSGGKVWSQTISVTPNTNYVFSTWVEALLSPTPSQLQFAINNNTIGPVFSAVLPTCTWKQYFTSWNSGSNTSITLSIQNTNTAAQPNYFALDDIVFAPLFFKRDSVIVTPVAPVQPSVTISTPATTICKNNPATFTAVITNGGPAPVYQWRKNGNPVGANSNTYTDATLNDGDIITCGVSSNAFCVSPTNVASNGITMTVVTPPAGIRYSALTALYNTPLQLQARNLGGSYNWQPPTGLSNNLISNPFFNYSQTQEYKISILTPEGCLVVDTQLVTINAKIGIYVPRAFSPNGDGNNDRLYPILVGIQELYYFKVYNRWGSLLFETMSGDPASGWDGRYKGALQPVETYTWVAQGIDINGQIIKKSGGTLLVR